MERTCRESPFCASGSCPETSPWTREVIGEAAQDVLLVFHLTLSKKSSLNVSCKIFLNSRKVVVWQARNKRALLGAVRARAFCLPFSTLQGRTHWTIILLTRRWRPMLRYYQVQVNCTEVLKRQEHIWIQPSCVEVLMVKWLNMTRWVVCSLSPLSDDSFLLLKVVKMGQNPHGVLMGIWKF